MQATIHPPFHEDTMVTCACGSTFTTGSTAQNINVEVCAKCHPLYTGEQKFLDTKGTVDKFLKKQEKAKKYKKQAAAKSKNRKDRQERNSQSLKELLGQ